MTKDENIATLTAAGVSLELTKAGEMTADQLELMVAGLAVPELNKVIGDREKTITDLQKSLDDEGSTIENLQKTITDLNGELTAAQQETRTAKKENPTLKLGNRVFELVIPSSTVRFRSERRSVTIKTLQEDEALLDYCIKINAGCLKDVTPSKSKK